ncbi:hypothetical protein [Amycolatopsis pigmentata]|uniref:PQQ-like domain-containing protein n=1 Tax=Amycolatopsis pigmentata TaxID=450801 RepID=A0ABW5FQQ2_9PSEU
MSRTSFARTLVLLGCAGALIAGCDSGTGSAPGPSSAQPPSAGHGEDLGYHGPALPGLEAQPIAHLVNITFGAGKPYVVGDSFAFVTFKGGADGDRSGSTPATVTFYDAITGRKTATADVPLWDLHAPQVGESGGAPAIFLHGTETRESDGLSRTKKVEHQVGFDSSGRKVSDLAWDSGDDRVAVAGWTATKATNDHLTREELTVYAADGAARLSLPADHGAITAVAPVLDIIAGDIALVRHTREGRTGAEHYLAAYDLARPGAPLWTSDTTRPQAATNPDASVSFLSRGTIGLIYPAGSGKATVAVQDVRTGAVKGATPAIDKYPGLRDSSVGEADNAGSGAAVLALTHASSGHGSVAVSLADGHVLWQQTGDQEGFAPDVVVGGTVYGTSAQSPGRGKGDAARPSLALDLATGRVQEKSLTTAPIAATDSGYAIVPEIGDDTSGEDAGAKGSYWIFRARQG